MKKTIYIYGFIYIWTRQLHQCSDHYEKASGVKAFLKVGALLVFDWPFA